MQRKFLRKVFVCLLALTSGLSASAAARGFDDLSALYDIPPATMALLKAEIEAEWAARNHGVAGFTIEAEGAFTGCQVRVFSHLIDGDNDGEVNDKHYVAVRFPRLFDPEQKYPVLLVNHGGTSGVNLNKLADFDAGLPDATIGDNFFIVLPSYRAEWLDARVLDPGNPALQFTSGGTASVLDYDVDDVITALNATLKNFKQADKLRVAAYGTSRGGAVTLLLDARDARIRRTVDMFGGANMLLTQEEIEATACGAPAGNPILKQLLEHVICPYRAGTLSLHEARLELVRRSAVFFAEGLFRLQIHHGTADTTVPLAHSITLTNALDALPGPPPYQFYVYPGGVHSVGSLDGQGPRVKMFLSSLL
ncbi:MAG: alpha/beta hydrolase family protein [Blastocatellales bacterium]